MTNKKYRYLTDHYPYTNVSSQSLPVIDDRVFHDISSLDLSITSRFHQRKPSQFSLNNDSNIVEMDTYQTNVSDGKKDHLKVFGAFTEGGWYNRNSVTLNCDSSDKNSHKNPSTTIDVLQGIETESSINKILQKIDSYITNAKNVYNDGERNHFTIYQSLENV